MISASLTRVDRLALEGQGVAHDLAHVVEHGHLVLEVLAGEDGPAMVVILDLGLVDRDAGGAHVVGHRVLVVRVVVLGPGEDRRDRCS